MVEFPRRVFDSLDTEELLTREWLITNGMGGYACGTLGGVCTRRYHSLLISAEPNPLGRLVVFNHLLESVVLNGGEPAPLSSMEVEGEAFDTAFLERLKSFHLEGGMPVWTYEHDGLRLEKRVLLPHRQNCVYVFYRLVGEHPDASLVLRPALHFRGNEASVNEQLRAPYTVSLRGNRYEFTGGPDYPSLRMFIHGEEHHFRLEAKTFLNVRYRVEERRGYPHIGALWSPGDFIIKLPAEGYVCLVASTQAWVRMRALDPEDLIRAETRRRSTLLARTSLREKPALTDELVLAADQFVIDPAGRVQDRVRAQARGDEVRTVIAGYHWFTDWGRDTMISLEGLCLLTGRLAEAGFILRTFGSYVRNGLIPNLFPEGRREGLYHTADATLWFFHALHRYLEVTSDRATLRSLLPTLHEIVGSHRRGTLFNIGVDPADGLLRQGAQGYQLTWMDAKVGDWVVTPRRGKAVEINALWYNALRLLEKWSREEGDVRAASELSESAGRAYDSFNRRFWMPEKGYLFDVVDGEKGDETCCRPNQIFAISLDYPILEESRWKPVLSVVQERLVTPYGLRTLEPAHPDYKRQYFGDLRARDAAYHQGTVWPWLIGPFIDAWLKVYPDRKPDCRRFLEAFDSHLNEACIGTISEVFDAEPPFHPRGCVAQAWSIAEVLRAIVKSQEAG